MNPRPERPRGPPLACGAPYHPQPSARSTPVTLALSPDHPPAPRLHSGCVPADTLAPAGAVTSGGHLRPPSLLSGGEEAAGRCRGRDAWLNE